MRIFVLNCMVDDDFESTLAPSSDVSNLVVHLGFALENQGHSFCDHIHTPADASPICEAGALENPFF